MTALDPAPVIARLRDQRHCTGVYDPDTVDELIATVESTGELRADALASVVPTYLPVPPRAAMPLAGRSARDSDTGERATVLSLRGRLRTDTPGCGRRGGRLGLLCTETLAHGGDHVARGEDGRVFDRWAPSGGTA